MRLKHIYLVWTRLRAKTPFWFLYNNLFRECYTAFLYLRRQSNLILNLFGLMVDASVPDIALEPDKTVKKVQVGTVSSSPGLEITLYQFNLIS